MNHEILKAPGITFPHNKTEQKTINKNLSSTETILSLKNKCKPAKFDLKYNKKTAKN